MPASRDRYSARINGPVLITGVIFARVLIAFFLLRLLVGLVERLWKARTWKAVGK